MPARHAMAAVKWTPLLLGVVLPLAVHADNVTDLMERGRWKDARAAVATMDPGKARTLYLQSRVKQAFDQQDEALAAAERAVQLEPNNALYHTQIAEVCGQMAGRAGKLKAFSLARRARKEAEQAVALDPKQVDGREVLANFFWLAPGILGGDDVIDGTLSVGTPPRIGRTRILQLDGHLRGRNLCLRMTQCGVGITVVQGVLG